MGAKASLPWNKPNASRNFVDASKLPYHLTGKKRVFIGPFTTLLTDYPGTRLGSTLATARAATAEAGEHGQAAPHSPATAAGASRGAPTPRTLMSPSTLQRLRTGPGEATDDNDELASPIESEASGSTMMTSSRRRGLWSAPHIKHLVFAFSVSWMDGSFSWHLRKTMPEFMALQRAVREAYGEFAPDFPRDVRFMRAVRMHWRSHRRLVARKLRLYLAACLQLPRALEFLPIREFLEFSATSLAPAEGPKFKEGYVAVSTAAIWFAGVTCVPSWQRYYAVLRDSYMLLFTDSCDVDPEQVILLDNGTEIHPGIALLGQGCAGGTAAACGGHAQRVDPRVLTLVTRQGSVVFRLRNRKEAEDWILSLQERQAAEPWAQAQPHSSFAPPRDGSNSVRWMVDAHNTYLAIVNAMKKAKYEIFLTGWWITPDLAVIRDPIEEGSSRAPSERIMSSAGAAGGSDAQKQERAALQIFLKTVIQERAEAGVKVYVLMYKEPPLALALSSLYQKRVLQSLNPNIFVQRHGGMLWTHHEKLVVIDREVAFAGGIDVCWGRWDTGGHIIVDPERLYFPQGVEYYNSAVADWMNVEDAWSDRVDRAKFPRMAWHDVHMSLRGDAVMDIVRHFIQRWNFTRQSTQKKKVPFLTPHLPWTERAVQLEKLLTSTMPATTAESQEVAPTLRSVMLAAALTSRLMPSHVDAGVQTSPTYLSGSVEAITAAHPGKRTAKLITRKPDTTKRHMSNAIVALQRAARRKQEQQALEGPRLATSAWYCARDWTQQWFKCDIQVLRSVGQWSAGTRTESSIYHAYVHHILAAESFIYIENQYFLSSLGWTNEELLDFEFAEGKLIHRLPDKSDDSDAAILRGEKPSEPQSQASMTHATEKHEDAGAGPHARAEKRWGALRSSVREAAQHMTPRPGTHYRSATDRVGVFFPSQDEGSDHPTRAPAEAHPLLTGARPTSREGAPAPTARASTAPVEPLSPSSTGGRRNTVSAEGAAPGAPAPARSAPRLLSTIRGLATLHHRAKLSRTASEPAAPPPEVSMDTVLEWDAEKNSVAEALFVRLCRAIEKKEKFRVVIVLPVHPDGPIRTTRAIQLVLHWQCCTISRGGYSLLERLSRKFPGVDLNDYVCFFALRKSDPLFDSVVTEQIYVHSKLMIVDDRVVILGSANLNDRSLHGDRDSEIAMILSGGEKVQTRMAGRPWTATVFAHTLRRNLWEEHLGVPHTCRAFDSSSSGVAGAELHRRLDNAHIPVCPIRKFVPLEERVPNGSAQQVLGVPIAAKAAMQAAAVASQAGLDDARGRTQSALTTSTSPAGVVAASSGPSSATPLSVLPVTQSAQGEPSFGFPVHHPGAVVSKSQACITLADAVDGIKDTSTHFAPGSAADTTTNAPLSFPVEEAKAEQLKILRAFQGLKHGCYCDAFMDPCDDTVYKGIWLAAAQHNTRVFNTVFPGIIQDGIRTRKDWAARDPMSPVHTELLDTLVGNLILWAKDFLCDDDLSVKTFEKERLLPTKVVQ